jgi:hypothetical protein
MVFLHLPGGGGNGHRIMHATAFYIAPTEGPGAPEGRPTIPNPSPFLFRRSAAVRCPKPSPGLPHLMQAHNSR